MPEGYGRTPGLYAAAVLDAGLRTTDPSLTTQAVAVPLFLTWSTPWDIAGAHVSVKTAPGVGVWVDSPGLQTVRPYNPYASVWLSWYLGGGINLSVGEGAQVGLHNDLTRMTGRDFTALQHNVAVTYLKNNWHATVNGFYTTGRTAAAGSQPRTVNADVTVTKRVARKEYGAVAYAVRDVNSPAVGYLPDGRRQGEVAVGALWGYFVGNLVSVQAKVTTDLYQSNFGGRDTRASVVAMLPLWTPPAPRPRRAR